MGPVHEELAPPFVHALVSQGYSVEAWLHPGSLLSKGEVFSAYCCKHDSLIDETLFSMHDFKYTRLMSEESQDKAIKNLNERNIDKVIFLTLQDEWSVTFAKRIYNAGINVTGIIHNVNKLSNKIVLDYWDSFTRSNPFVLAKHVGEALALNYGVKGQVISSVFEPIFSSAQKNENSVALQANQYKLVILGGINFQSRDYENLLNGLTQLPQSNLDSILITVAGGGKDRDLFISLVNKLNLENTFNFPKINSNSGRVSYELYYEAISESNAVLVLPGPGYDSTKITSALPSAITFCKPIITTSDIARAYELTTNELCFSSESLNNAIVKFLECSLLEYAKTKKRMSEYRASLLKDNVNALQSFLST